MNSHQFKYLPVFSRDSSIFTDCYCEENVWKLCEQRYLSSETKNALDSFFVVFISSEDQRIPMWNQVSLDQLTIWDYHVILIHKQSEQSSFVYDLSSKLPFPLSFHNYVIRSLILTYLTDDNLLEMLRNTRFRVINAMDYYRNFSSDRSHMWDDESKTWLSKPPLYDPIVQPDNQTGSKFTLHLYRNMLDDVNHSSSGHPTCLGKVVDLPQFCSMFGTNVQEMISFVKQFSK